MTQPRVPAKPTPRPDLQAVHRGAPSPALGHRITVVLLLALVSACAGMATQQIAQAPGFIAKSPSDPRNYRYIELANGLPVVLVSDRTANKAAAAIDVHAGSRHEPDALPGLAHFLEHMLFLGTASYPDADEYHAFIAAHGGSDNAFTGFEHTTYFFDIENQWLEPALDRFAGFFTEPLFDPAYIDRELYALDAEYRANLQQEQRRIVDATRQVVNPEHPFTRFSAGTRSTLSRPDIREQIIAFYRSHYSASRMTLVVLGNYSLDELQSMVTRRFAMIPNNGSRTTALPTPMFVEHDRVSQMPALLSVEARQAVKELWLTFEIDDVRDDFRLKQWDYLAHLLGHEGGGSLLASLKADGLAQWLGAGIDFYYRGGGTFGLQIGLTDEGLGDIEAVIARVYSYIGLVRRGLAEEPGRMGELYAEQAQLARMALLFENLPPEHATVLRLAANMHFYPRASIVVGDYEHRGFAPQRIERALDRLDPANMLVTVIAPELPSRFPGQQRTEHYQARYGIHALPQDWTRRWRDNATGAAVLASLTLPASNAFIPKVFTRYPAASKSPVPELQLDQPGVRLWSKVDDDFESPMADLYINLLAPSAFADPRDFAFGQIYLRAINERLAEYLYPAKLAGMRFGVYAHPRGYTLRLSGFSDKFLPLLERVLTDLRAAHRGELNLAGWREQQQQAWAFDQQQPPYQRAQQVISQLMVGAYWQEQELIAQLASIDEAAFARHTQAFWAEVYIEALAHGNFSEDMLADVAALLQGLPHCACDGTARLHASELLLSPGTPQLQLFDAGVHSDTMVNWMFQAPGNSYRDEAMTWLTERLLSAPFFAALRTEQQLGYVAQVIYQPGFRWPALHFLVQSPRASERQLLTAMRAFIRQLPESSDFYATRDALIAELLTPDPQSNARSYRFWRSIERGDAGFDRRRQLAAALAATEQAQWRDYVANMLGEGAPSLLVVTGPNSDDPDAMARELSARDLVPTAQQRQGYY